MLVLLSVTIFYYSHFVNCQIEESITWDKDQQKFVYLYNLSRFASIRGKAVSGRPDLDKTDISGKTLKVSYYEERDLIMFYDNDTKVTGICGDIWNLLAYHLNFTLIPVKYEERIFGEHLENGSYSGLMGLLQRNETQVILRTGYYAFRANLFDYTTPIWNTRYHLYIKPKYEYDNQWMLTMFKLETWYGIMFLFLMLSVAGYILQNERYENRKRREKFISKSGYFSFSDHFFYTYSVMCGQGYLPKALYIQNRILSISKTIFAWLILLMFSSDLIYRMTNRTMTPPFTSVGTLLNKTKYDLLVSKASIIYELVKNMQNSSMYKHYDAVNRIHFMDDVNTMYEKVCRSERLYAMLENYDKAFTRSKTYCSITAVGESYFQTWIGFGVARHFPYKHIIDTSIIKLHEVGLVNVLKNRWLSTSVSNKERIPFKTIDLEQVHLILLIPFIGIIVAILILSIENIVFYCETKHK